MVILYPNHQRNIIKWLSYYITVLLLYQAAVFPLAPQFLPLTPSLLLFFFPFVTNNYGKGGFALIQKMSSTFAKKIILVGNLQGVSESVLRFGCELILTSIFGTLILIALSLIMGHPLIWLFFLMGFAPLRTSAGGYHADTHIKCYSVTSLMFLLAAFASYDFTWYRFTYASVSVFSAIFTIIFAPLAATNKPLSPKRYRSNRINSLIIIVINAFIAVVFAMLNVVTEEANMYFAGIFFASASLGMGKIKELFIRRKAK